MAKEGHSIRIIQLEGGNRLIPKVEWGRFYCWPTSAQLNKYMYRRMSRSENGLAEAVTNSEGYLVINEDAFFEWAEKRRRSSEGSIPSPHLFASALSKYSRRLDLRTSAGNIPAKVENMQTRRAHRRWSRKEDAALRKAIEEWSIATKHGSQAPIISGDDTWSGVARTLSELCGLERTPSACKQRYQKMRAKWERGPWSKAKAAPRKEAPAPREEAPECPSSNLDQCPHVISDRFFQVCWYTIAEKLKLVLEDMAESLGSSISSERITLEELGRMREACRESVAAFEEGSGQIAKSKNLIEGFKGGHI